MTATPLWTPGPIWAGERVFVLGGGPSLRAEDVRRLTGARVIAVNGAYEVAPFADMLFFNDLGWYRRHERKVAAWPGLVVTASVRRMRFAHNVKRVQTETTRPFPPIGSGLIKWGPSSGHRAVATAVMLGAGWIGLLGFDMREVAGRTHFHDEYRNDPTRYRDLFIPGFTGWHSAAEAIGVTIVNLTAGSALTEFPMMSLDEVLACARS